MQLMQDSDTDSQSGDDLDFLLSLLSGPSTNVSPSTEPAAVVQSAGLPFRPANTAAYTHSSFSPDHGGSSNTGASQHHTTQQLQHSSLHGQQQWSYPTESSPTYHAETSQPSEAHTSDNEAGSSLTLMGPAIETDSDALGEALFSRVLELLLDHQDLSGKVTGVLLDLGQAEVNNLLQDQDWLQSMTYKVLRGLSVKGALLPEGISNSSFDTASEQCLVHVLGDSIFYSVLPLVFLATTPFNMEVVSKVTGMLLDLDSAQLLSIARSPETNLPHNVTKALNLLQTRFILHDMGVTLLSLPTDIVPITGDLNLPPLYINTTSLTNSSRQSSLSSPHPLPAQPNAAIRSHSQAGKSVLTSDLQYAHQQPSMQAYGYSSSTTSDNDPGEAIHHPALMYNETSASVQQRQLSGRILHSQHNDSSLHSQRAPVVLPVTLQPPQSSSNLGIEGQSVAVGGYTLATMLRQRKLAAEQQATAVSGMADVGVHSAASLQGADISDVLSVPGVYSESVADGDMRVLPLQVSSGRQAEWRLQSFSLTELHQATEGFDQSGVLRHDQHSTVYAGRLLDGKAVAVQVVSLSIQSGQDLFASLLYRLPLACHDNIISVLGYSSSGCMVFEHSNLQSLQDILKDPLAVDLLSLSTVLKVAKQLLSVVLFLEAGKYPHKPLMDIADIFLTDQLNVKHWIQPGTTHTPAPSNVPMSSTTLPSHPHDLPSTLANNLARFHALMCCILTRGSDMTHAPSTVSSSWDTHCSACSSSNDGSSSSSSNLADHLPGVDGWPSLPAHHLVQLLLSHVCLGSSQQILHPSESHTSFSAELLISPADVNAIIAKLAIIESSALEAESAPGGHLWLWRLVEQTTTSQPSAQPSLALSPLLLRGMTLTDSPTKLSINTSSPTRMSSLTSTTLTPTHVSMSGVALASPRATVASRPLEEFTLQSNPSSANSMKQQQQTKRQAQLRQLQQLQEALTVQDNYQHHQQQQQQQQQQQPQPQQEPPSNLQQQQRPVQDSPPSPEKEDFIPHHFRCPISENLLTDPVMTADGFTYERSCISEWLKRSNKSPFTMLPLDNLTLVPNRALLHAIEAWQTSHL